MASVGPQTIAVDGHGAVMDRAVSGRGVASYKSIGVIVGILEAGTIVVGGLMFDALYALTGGSPLVSTNTSVGVGLLTSLIYILACRSAGLYGLPALLSSGRHLKLTLTVCACAMLAVAATLFLLDVGPNVSRQALLVSVATALGCCCLIRIGAAGVIDGLMRRGAIAGRPAFIIGEEAELGTLSALYLLRHFGVREAGRLALRADDAREPALMQSRIEEAMGQARARSAKEFLVATRWDRAAHLATIEDTLRTSPLPVRLLPNAELRSIIGRGGSAFAAGAYTIELQRAPMGLAARAAKRVLDIAGASFAIVVLMPVFVAAAIAVKTDSAGPIVFRQRRNGFDRNQFVIFKFRTMRVLEDGAVVRQASRNDSRITRVGRVLRRTSIDELPQLFNVLRGDMSLVGPRPHALAHDQEFMALIGDYCMRHHVKPGITGWAQINGCRGETAHPELMQKRVDLDLWYIKNWSLRLDISILVRTALDVVRHDAY